MARDISNKITSQAASVRNEVRSNQTLISAVAAILWRLSSSDLLTFVLPNTLFGVCTALCTSFWVEEPWRIERSSVSWSSIMARIFKTLTWNWINLLLFNLSNQRLPDSLAEDKLNKPYRPIPSGLLSSATARQALLYGIYAVSLISYFWLGAHEESIIMVGLNWTYNDLRGGDENFVLRNLIIAIAFGVHNHASSRIIRGYSHVSIENSSNSTTITLPAIQAPQLSSAGQQWMGLVSLIILTTMQVQDFQDVEGDRKRGRRSLMLVVGMKTSRWLTTIPILVWCGAVPYALHIRAFPPLLLVMTGLGIYTAWRILYLTSKTDDNRSWKIWALWLISIYMLPLVA